MKSENIKKLIPFLHRPTKIYWSIIKKKLKTHIKMYSVMGFDKSTHFGTPPSR